MKPPVCIAMDSVICAVDDRVLLDIDRLVVEEGERVAIVGHNGAGKSTLLRLLSGFMRPAHGSLEVLGRAMDRGLSSVELRALRGELGQVMQGLHLVRRLNALENVLIGCLGRRSGWRTWLRRYRQEDIAEARSALLSVGLLVKAETRVDRLSGGERQKVAIARMLMQGPRLILADEPTAALDPQAAAEICVLLAKAAARSTATSKSTLIAVVHNPALLPLLADRVIGLKQGRMVFDLPVGQVDHLRLLELYRTDTPTSVTDWLPRRENASVMSAAGAR